MLNYHGRHRYGSLKALAFALFLLPFAAPVTHADECALVPAAPAAVQSEPTNIGLIKLQARAYKCSGAYERDIVAAIAPARAYLEERAGQVTKPALVLDIDETSLSNWLELAANDFGYIPDGPCRRLPKGPCGVTAWEHSARATVIAPTLALFNAAKGKGVAIFFITGRKDIGVERAATAKNLRAAGYVGWTGLVMRNPKSGVSGAKYKAAERAKIEAQGYKIIVNVGDQESDLAGGYAEKTFRLPNPFYFLP